MGELKSAVRSAALRILEPLAAWVLDAGMGVGDLNALLKIAFVRAARRQIHGAAQERPSVSRLAVLTGLTRAEVTKVLLEPDTEPSSDRGRQRAERVLSGWWNDPDFQDADGNPSALPLKGKKRSFLQLVERYSGERILVASILDALLRVKAVRRRADGKIQAVSRTYATVRWDSDGIESMGLQIAEHLEVLIHNLKAPAEARYVARVVSGRVDPRYVPMLVRDIREQAEGLVQTTDDALNAPLHTLRPGRKDLGAISLGLTVYVFQSSGEEAGEPSTEVTSATGRGRGRGRGRARRR